MEVCVHLHILTCMYYGHGKIRTRSANRPTEKKQDEESQAEGRTKSELESYQDECCISPLLARITFSQPGFSFHFISIVQCVDMLIRRSAHGASCEISNDRKQTHTPALLDSTIHYFKGREQEVEDKESASIVFQCYELKGPFNMYKVNRGICFPS